MSKFNSILSETLVIYKENLKETTKKHLFSCLKEKADYIIQDALHIVNKTPLIFIEDKDRLGFYDPQQKIICLNKKLANYNIEIGKNVYLHEVAHAVDVYYNNSSNHDNSFKKLCELFKCDSSPSVNIDLLADNSVDSITSKIKKLFALSSSNNVNESELALAKANQLIQQYNLSMIENFNKDDFELIESTIDTFKRKTIETAILYKILLDFSVYAIYTHEYDSSWRLTIVGSKANVEIAEYTYNYLKKEIPELFKENRISRSPGYKTCFYKGFYSGFNSKNIVFEKNRTENENNSLVLYKEQIWKKAENLFYRQVKISHTHSNRNYDYNADAYVLGKELGKRTTVNPAVKNSEEVLKLA